MAPRGSSRPRATSPKDRGSATRRIRSVTFADAGEMVSRQGDFNIWLLSGRKAGTD
jgi:hypothetical protein